VSCSSRSQSPSGRDARCKGTHVGLANATPDRSERQSLRDRGLGHDSLWIAWAAGALYSAPRAYCLAGLALLAKQNVSAITNVLVILGFNVVQFALIELPLIGLVAAPDRARALTGKLNDWMTAHRRIVTVCLAGAIGGYLLISGTSDLR